MRKRIFFGLFCLVGIALSSPAAEIVPAFAADDIDLAQCAAYVDGKQVNQGTAAAVHAALGLARSPETWSIPANAGAVRHFTVGFKKAVDLGTVCTPTCRGAIKQPLKPLEGRFISILKADAPYPGDVTKDDQWILLQPGEVKPLPFNTRTRELRVSEINYNYSGRDGWGKGSSDWPSVLGPLCCLKARYYAASDLGWIKRNQQHGFPEELWASWNDTQAVVGVVAFMTNTPPAKVDILKPTCSKPASVAAAEDWEPRGTFSNCIALSAFPVPTVTRAVRLTGIPFDRRNGTVFHALCPLVAMGDLAQRPGLESPPPYSVAYTMPMDGFVALDLHDKKTGKLARRLVGETARDKGPVQEGWDLKDEVGQLIQPGAYTWKAIVRPPFNLTYEMTAYNAGQPAWWAPPPGKGGGGWLGDHGAPNCAAAQDDLMWLGTGCAENGHSFIATDLEGNKVGGTGHLSWGFRGPSRVAADSRFGYAMTDTLIVRCDPKRDFKMRTVYTFHEKPELPWYALWGDVTTYGGLAARDGLLYCSVNCPSRWLKSSFLSDDMDPAKSQPLAYLYKGKGIRKGREDRNYDFYEYDELMLFYATFLTDKMPEQTPSLAGMPIPSRDTVSWGNAPNSGKLRGNLVVAFKKPVIVGSVLIPDAAIKVYALKPGVPFDKAVGTASGDAGQGDDLSDTRDALGDSEDFAELSGDSTVEDWIQLKTEGKPGQPTVALAPTGGVQTTALRYKVKRLPFTQVMGNRMVDVSPQAERVFAEGALTPQGGWRVLRKGRAVTDVVPAQVALVWKADQELRGLTLLNPPGEPGLNEPAKLAVDRWNGPAAGDPKAALKDDSQWKLIGPYDVPGHPVVHQMDFGTTIKTKAVRIRFMTGNLEGANDSAAGSDAFVAYRPVGNDPANLPVLLNERISVLKTPAPENDESEATLVRHIPFPKPNNLAFDQAGTLYCLSDSQVVTVPLKEGERSRVVVTRDKLAEPINLALDAKGFVYVTDNGLKVVKVFDNEKGELARTIGTPGGPKPGLWDPSTLINPAAVTVDKQGKVWVADHTYQPKRIMCYGADGKPYKWFLGPTQYGGGGTMDSRNRGVVMYQGMKFALDWDKRAWELQALLGSPVQRTVYFKDTRYLVGPAPGGGEVALVAEERDHKAIPIAALGMIGSWSALRERQDIRERFGEMDPKRTLFVWSDLNQNGVEEAAEVQTSPMQPHDLTRANWLVGEDLAMVTEGFRLRPTEFKGKVPVYSLAKLETWDMHSHGAGARTNRPWEDEKGRIFMVGTRLIDTDGKTVLWEYDNPYACHDGFYQSGYGYNRPAGKLNQEHFPIGHFSIGEEEYYVNNSDQGDWFCYTADGMLAGCLFGGPAGYGLRQWTLPEWNPGKTDLTDLRVGQEHYQGCVIYDGTNLYAVAGHNHMSIVRIDGLEKLQRLNGEVTVTQTDLQKTQEWQILQDSLGLARQEPKYARILRAGKPPVINGTVEEWPESLFIAIAETTKRSLHYTDVILDGEGALGYDEDNLYVAVRVKDDSPMKNKSENPNLLFKGGDAAEITLGLDPNADPKRTGPRAGDMRLLFSVVGGRPIAVLYKPVDPSAPADKRATFSSPVGQTTMDRVEVLQDARVAVDTKQYKQERYRDGTYWTLEAQVPWKSLGVKPPEAGTKIRGDFGYLESDQNGVQTAGRKYWSGKGQTVVCDVPSEARLAPALWGEIEFTKPDKTLRFESSASLDPADAEKMLKGTDDTDVNELLGE